MQHAGVGLGIGGVAAHPFTHAPTILLATTPVARSARVLARSRPPCTGAGTGFISRLSFGVRAPVTRGTFPES